MMMAMVPQQVVRWVSKHEFWAFLITNISCNILVYVVYTSTLYLHMFSSRWP